MTTLNEHNGDHAPSILRAICLVLIVFGCLLRFFEITHNSFIFYDEGMYLNHNLDLLRKIQQFPPKDGHEFFAIVHILFLSALATAKWLWFFISNIRVFVGGPEMFYFTRVLSAVCGVLTVALTYIFSRRLFRSKEVALLSAAVLAILPSHIFYSRLAMQESFSTLCMLAGIFFYCSGRKVSAHLFFSSIFLSAVYFTNYRMIVIPLLLGATEFVLSMKERRPFDWVKLLGCVFVFLGIILGIGLVNNGSNLFITTAWMGHQAQMASQEWHWLNVFSYPYSFYRLDGAPFTLMLVMNLYWIFKKDWPKVLPISLVLVQMMIFTCASEKGARYLCVILPFAAMAVALGIHHLIMNASLFKRWAPPVLLGLLIFSLLWKSVAVVGTPSGYEQAVRFIKRNNPQAKMLSTQSLIMGLWQEDVSMVQPAPKDIKELVGRYSQGYRYLVIDPQAYVSWTESGNRFTTPLMDYLGFIREHIPPVVKLPHLSPALLERFVFDHNENLGASVRFLNRSDEDLGAVYVYDLTQSLEVMQKVIQSMSTKAGM
jgi:hypothetical protein